MILNTLGGLIGYWIGGLFKKCLPNREKIDQKALELGTKVSLPKRLTAFLLDITIFNLCYGLIKFIIPSIFTTALINKLLYIISLIIYFILIPLCNNCKTCAHSFLNLKLSSLTNQENPKYHQIILYQFYFYFYYFGLPIILHYILIFLNQQQYIDTAIYYIMNLILIGIFVIYYTKSFFQKILGKTLIYERLSGVTLKNTIKMG